MHQKFTLAILIMGIHAVAKGQTSQHDSLRSPGKEVLTSFERGHVYDILLVSDRMTGLQVNNKRINPADFHLYDSIVQALRADLKEDRERDLKEKAEEK